jgi:pyruvate kinase
VFAATASIRVAGALTLYRGITPVVTEERDVERLEAVMLQQHLIRPDAVVVFVNVSAELNRVDANFLNVQKIG